jgi:regulatory protein
MKQWGKVKIEYELKSKKVSAYNIKLALKSIEEIDYLNTIQALTQKKWESIALEDEKLFAKKSKITTYLLQRGFEKQLVAEAIASIVENES